MPDILSPTAWAAAIPNSAWTTWGVMACLVAVSLWIRRHLWPGPPRTLQNLFGLFMERLCDLIAEILNDKPEPYVPLIGTLFIFVFVANLVGMIPGLSSPTSDLSVTSALAIVVFFSVPFFGVRSQGLQGYLSTYLDPNPMMLPFNMLSEITRTLSLAVRLFGNIMSGEFLLVVVIGVVTTVLKGYATVFIPFTFLLTLFLSILSLITATIQAYIFAVLALVYIGAAVERERKKKKNEEEADDAAESNVSEGAD